MLPRTSRAVVRPDRIMPRHEDLNESTKVSLRVCRKKGAGCLTLLCPWSAVVASRWPCPPSLVPACASRMGHRPCREWMANGICGGSMEDRV